MCIHRDAGGTGGRALAPWSFLAKQESGPQSKRDHEVDARSRVDQPGMLAEKTA